MSTYIYLRCDSHTPPIEAGSESGQHLYDLEQIWADIKNRDRIVIAYCDGFIPDNTCRCNTARFLAAHPHCSISVVDEYDRIHHPDGTITEQETQE